MKAERDIKKQEALVSVLWQFAKNVKTDECPDCTAEDGTSLRLAHVGEAMDTILSIFGFEKIDVQ